MEEFCGGVSWGEMMSESVREKDCCFGMQGHKVRYSCFAWGVMSEYEVITLPIGCNLQPERIYYPGDGYCVRLNEV